MLLEVRLANGHSVLAHLDGEPSGKFPSPSLECLPGTAVLLELRAFDLSAGKVVKVLAS
jgi:translation initiation factor IF-1